jgi:hypothetical protein
LSSEVRLEDLCAVCRSKNAGPFLITLDMIFKDPAAYGVVAAGRLITRELVADRYRIPPEDVVAIEYIDGLNAVKASYKRRLPAGSPGDPDCYGMNQEAPLLDISFPAHLFPPPASQGEVGGGHR